MVIATRKPAVCIAGANMFECEPARSQLLKVASGFSKHHIRLIYCCYVEASPCGFHSENTAPAAVVEKAHRA